LFHGKVPPGAVYVGRAAPGLPASPYANPFPVKAHGRGEALRLYREHLAAHPELVDAARRELAGRDLACWCARPAPGEPDLCHAPILMEAIAAPGTGPVPCLTIRQPWCWAIAHQAAAAVNAKRIENRSRRMGYRGPLWLHAGARSRWDTGGADSPAVRRAWAEWIRRPGATMDATPGTDRVLQPRTPLIDFGAIIARTQVTGCHLAGECDPGSIQCQRWGAAGQFHIELGAVILLAQPVPCRGALGLWYPDSATWGALRAQRPA